VPGRWVDVGEAARELDISSDAVRKLISRGSLRSDRHGILVWLDERGTEAGREVQVDRDALVVEDLRIQVHYLREVLNEERDARRRADTIIAQLTQANAALAQRVPELQAPQEPRGASETAAAGEGRAAAESRLVSGMAQEGSTRPPDTAEWPARGSLLRPWWRRVFGA
jgi:hypothetical protein